MARHCGRKRTLEKSGEISYGLTHGLTSIVVVVVSAGHRLQWRLCAGACRLFEKRALRRRLWRLWHPSNAAPSALAPMASAPVKKGAPPMGAAPVTPFAIVALETRVLAENSAFAFAPTFFICQN